MMRRISQAGKEAAENDMSPGGDSMRYAEGNRPGGLRAREREYDDARERERDDTAIAGSEPQPAPPVARKRARRTPAPKVAAIQSAAALEVPEAWQPEAAPESGRAPNLKPTGPQLVRVAAEETIRTKLDDELRAIITGLLDVYTSGTIMESVYPVAREIFNAKEAAKEANRHAGL
jgi:hypothetical protein